MSSNPTQDRITLFGIKLQPRIGVTPGERRLPQPCQADLTVWGDFEAAATTDSLDRAIDYSRMLSVVLETAHSREYNLLETLAYRIAKDVLQTFPAERVGVRVRKRPAPLADKVDYIEVEVFES
ncbi:MAG: dihydroneopterin aldolase [Acidobacteria bacterium]|nr:MAG: dihydroneopterin aldolase [Acidobacteriota bacterium]